MNVIRMTYRQTLRNSLILVSIVFFLWGFITWMNYHFIPVLQFILALDKKQEGLMQLVFFGGYLLMAIPAAFFLTKLGYKTAFISGLLTIGVGSLLFCGAATYIVYSMFLLGFFIMATGITLLQVAANTYVVLLGNSEKGAGYLCLLQGINSFGISIIPLIAAFIYPYGKFESVIQSAQYMVKPYFIIALFCIVLALVFIFYRFTVVPVSSTVNIGKVLKNNRTRLASFAIFMYVGAEFFIVYCISYLCSQIPQPLSANHILLIYWLLAMAGRFAGWYWNKQFSLTFLLQVLSLSAIVLVIMVPFVSVFVSIFLLAFLGLCHSVMFPLLFADAIRESDSNSVSVAAVMVLAILGGGIIPLVAFYLAKWVSIPLLISSLSLCYAFVWYYAYYVRHKLVAKNID